MAVSREFALQLGAYGNRKLASRTGAEFRPRPLPARVEGCLAALGLVARQGVL